MKITQEIVYRIEYKNRSYLRFNSILWKEVSTDLEYFYRIPAGHLLFELENKFQEQQQKDFEEDKYV